jgi:hypothetical protein
MLIDRLMSFIGTENLTSKGGLTDCVKVYGEMKRERQAA